MKAAYSRRDGLAVATLVVLLNFAAGHEDMMMTLTAGGYGPSSSSAGPRINWTPLAVNAMGNFTLISAASNDSAMNYVSFAFSNGTKMEDAFTVVDCYEIGNEVKVGTSKNVLVAGGGKNSVNDPTSFSQLRLLSATKSAGVLTCSFEMKFMPTLEVKVMLAFGAMASGANASSPKKEYHKKNAHFSASTIGQVLATSIMPSTPSVMPSTPRSEATSMRWSCGLLPFVIGAMKSHLL